jgi:GNAT superfamily N-acetyltransferase
MQTVIRKGVATDVPHIMRLVQELALFERQPEQVVNTEKMLLEDGFGEHSIYKVFVAEHDGEVVGIALYYTAYSTWKGKIFFLDDIVITEKCRRLGIGKLLINEVMKAAVEANVNQIRWQVLEWNAPAISFYKGIGMELDDEWINCRMSKEQIAGYVQQLAN